ncbi:conserved hypothetical protein [Ricinus communis]|uniref:Uncharacterized protein n=1 Tax=Ricinus communis TaxID=3988 RepID=B9TK20_RICCO|nr:conserved hypothetical protein [Ricinus communis]
MPDTRFIGTRKSFCARWNTRKPMPPPPGNSLAGRVSVGLVPFSSAATLSVDLLAETRKRHPGILLHLTESVARPIAR